MSIQRNLHYHQELDGLRFWRTWFKLGYATHYLTTPVKPTRKQLNKWRKKVIRENRVAAYHDHIFSQPDEAFK